MPSTTPTDEILSNDVLSNIPNVEISNMYELPPRNTRGVPPRRYDL